MTLKDGARPKPKEDKDIRLHGGFIVSGLASGHAPFHWFLQSFVVVLPEIQSAFQLSAIGVGAILTVRELASGIVALPGGVVVDMLRKHWGVVLAACIGGISLGAFSMGLSPVYPVLLAGVAAVAMGHSVWHLAAVSSMSYHFSHRRGLALSFHGVGGSIGDVAGPVVTGALLGVLSWRGILSVYAVVPFFMAFMAFWAFRRLGKDTDGAAESGAALKFRARVEVTKRLFKSPVLWGVTLVKGLRGMALVGLVTLLPLYLDNDLGLSTFSRGVHIGLLIAIGLVAKPVAGYISDRVGRKQVLVPGLLWSCAICLLIIPYGEGVTLTVLIALLGLFLYPDQPILTAATLDIVGADVSSTALGMMAFIGFLLSAVSALIVGGLYETWGVDPTLYYIAALFALAATVFGLLRLTRIDAGP
jgi:MFS family permease